MICAWCQRERGETPSPGESHGICLRHHTEILASLGIRISRDAEEIATVQRVDPVPAKLAFPTGKLPVPPNEVAA